jgi:heme/copper-type cytochrome/quinol oxidase subunit 2
VVQQLLNKKFWYLNNLELPVGPKVYISFTALDPIGKFISPGHGQQF